MRWWTLNRKSHKAKESKVIHLITKVKVTKLSEENTGGNSVVLRKTKVDHAKLIAITTKESVDKLGMIKVKINSSKDTVEIIDWKPTAWEKIFIKQIPKFQSRIYGEFPQKVKQPN